MLILQCPKQTNKQIQPYLPFPIWVGTETFKKLPFSRMYISVGFFGLQHLEPWH